MVDALMGVRRYEHLIQLRPGYDCLRFLCRWGDAGCQPGAAYSHGRAGLTMRFIVKGDEGAVQFVLRTDWLPQYVEDKAALYMSDMRWAMEGGGAAGYPLPCDLGYHSKTPRYEGQPPIEDWCELTDGPCYYEGSTTDAAYAMYALVNGGDTALWAFLDAYYEHVFHDGEWPVPTEYPAPLREVVHSSGDTVRNG